MGGDGKEVHNHDSKYNLLDEPWIGVTYLDGTVREISLKGMLLESQKIGELSGDMPQQVLPLLRLGLAVLYKSYGLQFRALGERNDHSDLLGLWKAIWQSGHFDAEIINDYLDSVHDRFFLFDPTHPFYQTPGLTYSSDKKEYDDIGELIADVPKPKKFLFSMRSRNNLQSISLAEAARWLVFLQAYDTAGIKSPVVGETHIQGNKVYPPKAKVGTGWLGALGGVYLEGESLFKTLMLNWCLFNPRMVSSQPWFGNTKDCAPWERDPDGPDMIPDYRLSGPVDLLTLQSRRIRLVFNESYTRVCGIINCYGDAISADNMDDLEFMTAWRDGSEQLRKKLGLPTPPHMPVRFASSKAIWRQLLPLISVQSHSGRAGDDTRPGVIKWVEELQEADCLGDQGGVLKVACIHTQSMTYGTQSSVYDDAIDDSLDANLQLLKHDAPAVDAVTEVIGHTEDSVKALSTLVLQLEASSGSKAAGDRLYAASDRIKERAYADLDELFRAKIANFDPSIGVEAYKNQWCLDVHKILLRIGSNYMEQSQAPTFIPLGEGVKAPQQIFDKFRWKLNDNLGDLDIQKNMILNEEEAQ